MTKEEKINYLAKSIEELIDAKANVENAGWMPVYQARANTKEWLEILMTED